MKLIIMLAAAAMFALPSLSLAQTSDAASTTATTTGAVVATTTPAASDYRSSAVVEAKVRSYFADIPVMISIAQCESKFTQFNGSGAPLNGGSGGMIGIFQISASVHRAFALSLGFDIDTVDGNIGYARYLYNKSGTDPWIDSFPCWGGMTNNPEITTSSPNVSVSTLNTNLSFGMTHPQVVVLQQVLNMLGYTIATDGPGSPGQETTKFGLLTRDAVRKFQCAKNIVCSGDEGSSGYGFVGVRTRAALASAAMPAGQSSSPSAQPTPSQASIDKAAQIASLKAQIDQYLKLANDLKSQVSALEASQ